MNIRMGCGGRGAGRLLGLLTVCGALVAAGAARAELPSDEESALRERGTWISNAQGQIGRGRSNNASMRLASLGQQVDVTPAALSLGGGGGVAWRAPESCLNSALRSVIANVAANYGPVTVSSTCRSRAHNHAVGGATHSHHLGGDAADIRVRGDVRAAAAYMRSAVGGFKHYGGGLFHIDTGARRSW